MMSFSFFLFEGDEFLADEVEDGIKDGAGEGGNILLQGFGFAGKELEDKGLCDAVGEQGADGNDNGKAYYLLYALILIFEGEVFIEEKTHDTAGNIVCGDAEPVGRLGKI